MSFRVQPHRDIRITQGQGFHLDPSTAPLDAPVIERVYPSPAGGSSILIDATTCWDFPPVFLARKDFMENARKIWERLGLPAFEPKSPWYGYSLGYWTSENEEEAELALKGEHFQTG
ncbi:MAG: hypothetical protein U1D67_08330, partial [Dehalococcoidia bacterium]|nr:hypothetical protein [Dehalococcoidia bacterium]